jgi:hypothetical protein
MLKTSSSCWSPIIRTSHTMILLKSGSKVSLKKLSLRSGLWRFWSSLRGSDWLQLASRCLRTLTGTSSDRQKLDRWSWRCLLWGDSVGEGVFVSPDFGALFLQVIFTDSCVATCTVGHRRWWSRWSAYSSRGSTSRLNCHLFVISYFVNYCVNFSQVEIYILIGQNRLSRVAVVPSGRRRPLVIPLNFLSKRCRVLLPLRTSLQILTCVSEKICLKWHKLVSDPIST